MVRPVTGTTGYWGEYCGPYQLPFVDRPAYWRPDDSAALPLVPCAADGGRRPACDGPPCRAVRVAVRRGLGDVVAPHRPGAGRVRRALPHRLAHDADERGAVPPAGAMVAPERGGRGHPRDRGDGPPHAERPVPVPCPRGQPAAAARPVPVTRRRHHRDPGRDALDQRAVSAPGPEPPLRARPRRGAARTGVRDEAGGASGARPAGPGLPRHRRELRRGEPLAAARDHRRPRAGAPRRRHRRGGDLPPDLAVGPGRRDHVDLRAGGQDRPHAAPDDGAVDHRRPDRGPRRDAGVLARVRARPRDVARGEADRRRRSARAWA